MDKLIIWKEVRIAFEGNFIRGSYSLSRAGLVTVKTAHGTKAAHRAAGMSAHTVARILLRELAAEGKTPKTKKRLC
jgi:hypothetical protein